MKLYWIFGVTSYMYVSVIQIGFYYETIFGIVFKIFTRSNALSIGFQYSGSMKSSSPVGTINCPSLSSKKTFLDKAPFFVPHQLWQNLGDKLKACKGAARSIVYRYKDQEYNVGLCIRDMQSSMKYYVMFPTSSHPKFFFVGSDHEVLSIFEAYETSLNKPH